MDEEEKNERCPANEIQAPTVAVGSIVMNSTGSNGVKQEKLTNNSGFLNIFRSTSITDISNQASLYGASIRMDEFDSLLDKVPYPQLVRFSRVKFHFFLFV